MLAIAVGVAVIAAMFWISKSEEGGYASPDAAVTATCHAAHILGDSSGKHGRYRVGWQERGEAPGFGWTALVEGRSGGYHVVDCRFQGVVHG